MGLTNMSSVDSMFDYSGLIPRYFDLIVEGGGPNSLYLLGLYEMLKKLEKTGDIRVSKYAGSDVAAILCVFLCANIGKEKMTSFCEMMFDDITNDRWKKELLRILPKDAHSMCNNRVYIHTSVPMCCSLMFFYRKGRVFSEFCSNRDIVEACSISFKNPSRVNYTGKEKQLRVYLDRLNERFDTLVFSQKRLFQFYKMTRMTELMLKAQQDAEDFFSDSVSRLSNNRLRWRYNPPPHKKYRVFCYFIPSVIVIFYLLRKK